MVYLPSPKTEVKLSSEYIEDLERRLKEAFSKLDTQAFVNIKNSTIEDSVIKNCAISGVLDNLTVKNLRVLENVYHVNELKINECTIGDSEKDSLFINARVKSDLSFDNNHKIKCGAGLIINWSGVNASISGSNTLTVMSKNNLELDAWDGEIKVKGRLRMLNVFFPQYFVDEDPPDLPPGSLCVWFPPSMETYFLVFIREDRHHLVIPFSLL